jgi:two-component system CheB/CheR fusion protein
VVIDSDMAVRAWNRQAEELWGLRADEVDGKHFLNLDIGLPVERLRKPIRDTLAGGPDGGEVVVDAVNRRGRAISSRITVSPLLRDSGVVGAILVMR